MQAAADEVASSEPAKALELEKRVGAPSSRRSASSSSTTSTSPASIKVAEPIQDKLAKELGPHAVKILGLVRNVK